MTLVLSLYMFLISLSHVGALGRLCFLTVASPRSFLARRDYVPGELMLSPRRWRRRLSTSASASASALAQCLSFLMCA